MALQHREPENVIATSAAGPQSIVANNSNVYFTTNSEIYPVPTTGGTPASFATISGGNGDSGAYGMALDSSYLYFTDYGAGRLNRVTLASPYTLSYLTSFGYSSYYAHGMAVAGGNVYWGGYTSGQIEETPIAGSSITQGLFNAGGGYSTPTITSDSTNVYWAVNPNPGFNPPNHGGVYELPLTATSSTGTVTLASGLASPKRAVRHHLGLCVLDGQHQ